MHIYIITNKLNKKKYVGQTSLENPMVRVNQHFNPKRGGNKSSIKSAIKKYGRGNFDIEIISYPEASQKTLNSIEISMIKQLKTITPHGYNVLEGGKGISKIKKTATKRKSTKLTKTVKRKKSRSKK